MKTLSPTVITLPWRPDAAEHYFAPVNHLPWAMLLHSGDAIHPYNRFDILVADPVTTLTTRAGNHGMYCAHDYRHFRRSVTRFADSTGGAAFSSSA